MLTLLYVISFLDRSNIANANVAGMSDSLDMTGAQYRMANTVFCGSFPSLSVDGLL